MYYIYILRCNNNSLYTGITIDVKRRMKEHLAKGKKCAKYTVGNSAKKLEMAWESENRAMACKLEYHLKQLSKKDKEQMIKDGTLKLLEGKVCFNEYKVVNINEM